MANCAILYQLKNNHHQPEHALIVYLECSRYGVQIVRVVFRRNTAIPNKVVINQCKNGRSFTAMLFTYTANIKAIVRIAYATRDVYFALDFIQADIRIVINLVGLICEKY